MTMTTPTAAELFSLEGSVALVTGATTGIGYATAQTLASAGARTVLTGLPDQKPGDVAAALAESDGLPIVGLDCDVNDTRQLAAVVDHIMSTCGRLDTVLANAGVARDTGPHTTTTDEQLDAMFDVHVRSVLHLANLAIPRMAEGGGGSFIIMSSLAAHRGNKAIGGYAITKAANAQLARNLAVQWGEQGIRVNALSPGMIETDMTRGFVQDESLAGPRLAKTPMRQFGQPHHVAGAVVWLASQAGSFTSGQNIVLDGGTLIND